MKTIVSIPHHEYPATVRELVEEKLQNLAKYYERIESLRAVLSREAEEHRVELVATVGQGVTLVVDSRGDLFESSLAQTDGATDHPSQATVSREAVQHPLPPSDDSFRLLRDIFPGHNLRPLGPPTETACSTRGEKLGVGSRVVPNPVTGILPGRRCDMLVTASGQLPPGQGPMPCLRNQVKKNQSSGRLEL